jgi:hypothetical protein
MWAAFCSWTAIIKSSGNLCSFESCHCVTTVPPAYWHRTSNLGNQAAPSNVCMIHNIWLWSRFCGGCQSFHYHCIVALHSLCVFVFLSWLTPIYVTVPQTKLLAWSQLHAKWVLFCKVLCSKGLWSDMVQEQWSRFGRISEVWSFSHSGTC